jgi:hypothetical protein
MPRTGPLLLPIFTTANLLLHHSYYNDARDHDDDGSSKRFDWRDCVGQYKLYYLVRSMHVLAMLLCALHLVARIVYSGFQVQLALVYDELAAACDVGGKETERSRSVKTNDLPKLQQNANYSFVPSLVVEAAVISLMAVGFLLFFPACIVMFRRVERKLDAIMQEMDHRSNIGSVFLPFEFSPAAADGDGDGARTQVEMPIVEARVFLGRIKSAAAAQRRRFLLCLALVVIALAAQAFNAVALARFTVVPVQQNPACGDCDACQPVEYLIKKCYDGTPERFPLVSSLCWTLPLAFSLWLMTTKEDRMLLLQPHRFRSDAVALQPIARETEARLKVERLRMGVELL